MKFVEEIMGFTPFEKKVWLATPTIHGEELKYMPRHMKRIGCLRSAQTSMR